MRGSFLARSNKHSKDRIELSLGCGVRYSSSERMIDLLNQDQKFKTTRQEEPRQHWHRICTLLQASENRPLCMNDDSSGSLQNVLGLLVSFYAGLTSIKKAAAKSVDTRHMNLFFTVLPQRDDCQEQEQIFFFLPTDECMQRKFCLRKNRGEFCVSSYVVHAKSMSEQNPM